MPLPKIFVQIAAYRDAECEWTIRDIFKKAAHPDQITIGVCWQYKPGADDHLLPLEVRKDQVKLITMEAKDSRGPCWARHRTQSLWNGEDYLLQIDSHMRFEPNWDEKLIHMLSLCPVPEKSVLTGYPPPYTPPDNLGGNERQIMLVKEFTEDGILTFQGTTGGANNSVPAPVYGMFFSGGFLFAPASVIKDVPYDPYLYFYGEEITMSVRLWTHGYDLFHPNENVLYHYYKESGDTTNRTHWADNTEWHKINTLSLARVKHLLDMEPSTDAVVLQEIEKYGLGKVRTLQEYERISGVNFKTRTFAENATKGIFEDLGHMENKQQDNSEKSWPEWVKENLDNNCDPVEIKTILLKSHFGIAEIKELMGDRYPLEAVQVQISAHPLLQGGVFVTTGVDHKALCEIPLLRLGRHKKIMRINDPRLQLLVLDDFMTDQECDKIIEIMNPSLRPSTVTIYGGDSFRTSSTSDLVLLNDSFVKKIDKKIAQALGINLEFSEGIQAQKYAVGQEFKPHTDFFEPGSDEFKEHATVQGNRTWTFMVYLNNTKKGGGTNFVNIDKTFYPKKGRAVIWNNLYADGTANYDTLHWGMPIEKGEKMVITKWFREIGKGEMFDKAQTAPADI